MKELKLDYDEIDEKTLFKILEKRKFVFFHFRLRPIGGIVAKTKRGWHVYIRLKDDLDDLDVAFIQAVLGDDFKRACFNWSRVRDGMKVWNVLFTENETIDEKLTKKLTKMLRKWTEEIEDKFEFQSE